MTTNLITHCKSWTHSWLWDQEGLSLLLVQTWVAHGALQRVSPNLIWSPVIDCHHPPASSKTLDWVFIMVWHTTYVAVVPGSTHQDWVSVLTLLSTGMTGLQVHSCTGAHKHSRSTGVHSAFLQRSAYTCTVNPILKFSASSWLSSSTLCQTNTICRAKPRSATLVSYLAYVQIQQLYTSGESAYWSHSALLCQFTNHWMQPMRSQLMAFWCVCLSCKALPILPNMAQIFVQKALYWLLWHDADLKCVR